MATETVTLRPATAADAETLADLVVQLYHTEVPGGLRSPRAGQLRLFRYLIEHELAGGVRGRFLAVDEGGAPVGSASVRLYGDPTLATLPPGLASVAVRSVGLGDTLRIAGAMLRGSLVGETTLRRGECFIYSVVVAERQRGRGLGQAMMVQLEAHARHAGARIALLRVIVGNERARSLYLKLGYEVVSRTPPWIDRVALPSELMRKEL
jgi:ribosomal protein S18 acetylase RimI-like enzyme